MNSYLLVSGQDKRRRQLRFVFIAFVVVFISSILIVSSPLFSILNSNWIFAFGFLPAVIFGFGSTTIGKQYWIEYERRREYKLNIGNALLGSSPPQRDAFERALQEANAAGKKMLDRYLLGFSFNSGAPLWIENDIICKHLCVISKNRFDKTAWFLSLMLQQMLRNRASGFTFIDSKKDSSSLNQLIIMAIHAGRIEDLIIIDPERPVHSYNFVISNQSADVKATKILRAAIPAELLEGINKSSNFGADYIYRIIRVFENIKLTWSLKDLAAALSNFEIASPYLRKLLNDNGNRQAFTELGQLTPGSNGVNSFVNSKKDTDEILKGLSSELQEFLKSSLSNNFCSNDSDLNLTDAIFRGKIIYYKVPSGEDAKISDLASKAFREDLRISMGEVASSRSYSLEDPHMIFIDEDSSNVGSSWNTLLEVANNNYFSLLFGVTSESPTDQMPIGLNSSFCEKILPNVGLKVFLGIEESYSLEDLKELIGKSGSINKPRKSIERFDSILPQQESDNPTEYNPSFKSDSTADEGQDSELFDLKSNPEKEIACFYFNDGSFIKGSALTVKTDEPKDWNGRKFADRFERFEKDDVGLSAWIELEKRNI